MAWTATNTLRDFLAGGGSIEDAFTGGDLQFFDVTPDLLATCNISGVDVTDNVVTLTLANGTVVEGVSAQDPVSAAFRNSGGDVLLSTNSVSDTGDIAFANGEHLGWETGGIVSVSPVPVTLTAINATAAP